MLICIQRRPCVKTGYFQIPGFTQSLLRSGTDGVRTHDLSRVRRTLIPAELPFHIPPVSSSPRLAVQTGKQSRKILFIEKRESSDPLFPCGRWDLNPHAVASTRSLVLLVCQFRHFRMRFQKGRCRRWDLNPHYVAITGT